MTKTKSPQSPRLPARQRIIETAERLFYAEGVRAVGVDRIIAEAGVAKMTLYNHFGSKDDLILAVLQYRHELIERMFADSMRQHVATGLDRLRAFFAALRDWFGSPGFRGCAFINACVELADAEHPGSRYSVDHKVQFHQLINNVISETYGSEARAATPAVALLVEGAIVSAAMNGDPQSATVAERAALALVEPYAN